MDERQYPFARSALLTSGDVEAGWLDELRRMVSLLARRGMVPPALAPAGAWDDDAIDDLLQSWVTRRLIGRGQLRSIVAQAGTLSAFRLIAERSLRQHVLDLRPPSQQDNLFRRLRRLVEEDARFRCFVDGSRVQDRWWGLTDWKDPDPFAGDDRRLDSLARAVPGMEAIVYRSDARKLSPVLAAGDLSVFSAGLLEQAQRTLTLRLIVRALELRFGLAPTEVAHHDHLTFSAQPGRTDPADVVALRHAALATLAELSRRQVIILLATDRGESIAAIAAIAECSPATVINEQRRIGAVVDRVADGDGREDLLNATLDLLYEKEDDATDA